MTNGPNSWPTPGSPSLNDDDDDCTYVLSCFASCHLLQLYSEHDLVSSFSSGPPVLRPTAVQYTKAVYVLTLRTGTLQAGRIGSRLRKMDRTMRRNAS